jgi:hypothetical protein
VAKTTVHLPGGQATWTEKSMLVYSERFLILAYRYAAFSLGLFNSMVAPYTVICGLKSVVLSVLDRQ